MEYNEKALANYIEKNFSEVKMVKFIVDSNMTSDKIFTQAIIKEKKEKKSN